VLIAWVVSKLELGGAQLSLLRVSRALAARGHRTRLFAGAATPSGVELARSFGTSCSRSRRALFSSLSGRSRLGSVSGWAWRGSFGGLGYSVVPAHASALETLRYGGGGAAVFGTGAALALHRLIRNR